MWLFIGQIKTSLSLATKFQIYTKVLGATHVYYSSCWVPSTRAYQQLEKLLKDFLWANISGEKGFHRVNYNLCCLPKDWWNGHRCFSHIDIILMCQVNHQSHGRTRSMEGFDGELHYFNGPHGQKHLEKHKLSNVAYYPTPVIIRGGLCSKSIARAQQANKPKLVQKRAP